jgi:hypothetical protein
MATEQRTSPSDAQPKIRLLPPSLPLGWRRALAVLGAAYILAVFSEGVGGSLAHLVYRPVLYFAQIAALFPHPATHVIEYRAQAYACDGSVSELDVRPYFPIHADDKESRFDRAMYFYRQHRPTMEALDAYLVREHNQSGARPIGGVSLMSLRIPLPEPGSAFPRYRREPLEAHPAEQRKVWYFTPRAQVLVRCQGGRQ